MSLNLHLCPNQVSFSPESQLWVWQQLRCKGLQTLLVPRHLGRIYLGRVGSVGVTCAVTSESSQHHSFHTLVLPSSLAVQRLPPEGGVGDVAPDPDCRSSLCNIQHPEFPAAHLPVYSQLTPGTPADFSGTHAARHPQIPFYLLPGASGFCQWTEPALFLLWDQCLGGTQQLQGDPMWETEQCLLHVRHPLLSASEAASPVPCPHCLCCCLSLHWQSLYLFIHLQVPGEVVGSAGKVGIKWGRHCAELCCHKDSLRSGRPFSSGPRSFSTWSCDLNLIMTMHNFSRFEKGSVLLPRELFCLITEERRGTWIKWGK